MINLAGAWKMRAEHLDVGPERALEVAAREEGTFGFLVKGDTRRRMPTRTGFVTAQVPCDVMEPLIAQGLLPEPLIKTHTDDCLWMDSLSWWLVRDFDLPEAEYAQEQVWLTLEMLDYNADILLNGRHVANHRNTFRPFARDVKEYLRPGANQLIVRLTGGYELHHPQDALTFYNNSTFGQRVYLRKPQFTHGWDWCKPMPTCGIGGRVTLEGVSGAVVRALQCRTVALAQDSAALELHLTLDNLRVYTADDACLQVSVSYGGESVYAWEEPLYLPGGISYVTHRFALANPHLWWPNGSGEQALYTVSASVTCRGVRNVLPEKSVGIRTIALDMGKLPDGSRRFDVLVNGRRIFMKGGNWVPADSLYLRVTEEKYRALVSEAAACHSNMLRVWGGGLYEPDCFYDACSEQGILVMQDFMYACGFYPDHLAWFCHEAALEADYQTQRLGHQACLALWTGNNEIHESFTDWYAGTPGMLPEKLQGAHIFNYLLPEIVRKNTPDVPYMPSSPFYGNKANDILAGDCHLWSWTREDKPTGFRFFYELEAMDRMAAAVRFSSEYGFYGALRRSSVERYHAGEPLRRDGAVFIHHGERASKHRLIDPSLRTHVAEPDGLDMDGYLLYTGIVQGLLYEEMALALRRQPHCSGHLIWMYNDCWPETGWSVIDYYLTRKISFYFLKRAHAPLRMILRAQEGHVSLVLANDGDRPYSAALEVGDMDMLGDKAHVRSVPVHVPAFGWRAYTLPLAEEGLPEGRFCYALDAASGAFATSLRAYYRAAHFPQAKIEILAEQQAGKDTVLSLCANAFVPVAAVETEDDRVYMSDNYFPMLPGVPREVIIAGKPKCVRVTAVAFDAKEERL